MGLWDRVDRPIMPYYMPALTYFWGSWCELPEARMELTYIRLKMALFEHVVSGNYNPKLNLTHYVLQKSFNKLNS